MPARKKKKNAPTDENIEYLEAKLEELKNIQWVIRSFNTLKDVTEVVESRIDGLTKLIEKVTKS
jgi:hypothetical protein